MKNNYVILGVLGMFTLFTSCKNEKKDHGKQMGALYLSEAKPQPGDQLKIRYAPEKDSVQTTKNAETLTAYYYYMVNKNRYPQDLKLTDSSGVWNATVAIPDSATAIAFNFKKGKNYDSNHKKGYVQLLYSKQGNPIAGSYASAAMFYQRYKNQVGMSISTDSINAMMKRDLDKNPNLASIWEIPYAGMLYRDDKNKGTAYIDKRLKAYRQKDSLTENQYNNLVEFYRLQQNKDGVDSITQLAAKKFPKGKAVENQYLTRFFSKKTLANRQKIFDDYNKNIGKEGRSKDQMRGALATAYLKKGDKDNYRKYADQISNKHIQASIYNNAAWDMVLKNKNLDKAEKISKKSLDLIESLKNNKKAKPIYYTQNQFNKSLNSNYQMYADTYGLILFKQGKVKKAISYQEKAVGDGNSSDVNGRYIQFLVADKQYKKAQQKAAEFIASGNADQELKKDYKKAYTTNTGSAEGVNEQLRSLEKQAHQKELAALKNSMLNKKAPNFTLKDLDGKEVELSALKGKTVILDFWATWCGPCKASFPGMQTAVNNYKDDPSVKFYFIDTFERLKPAARKQNVASFIKEKKYPFHVLLDQSKENSNGFETVEAYGITGIPTKIIIGPDGKWKFTKVGFSGNNTKLTQEIDMMIELSKS